jgi:uncharacterized phage protein gp47/JayE
LNLGREYVLTRATKIDPAQVDVQGSDVNIFVGSTSVVAWALITQLAYQTNRLLLDGAEGEDLDRLSWDRYRLPRKGAAPAVGTVQFRRTSAAGGLGIIPVGTKLQTNDGIEYTTLTAASFGASDLESKADVQAVQSGKSFQVGAQQIVRFGKNPIPVFDGTITVTNDDPTAGGEDRELDEVFKERIRDFWNTARRGTLAAIEFGAKEVPGVASAQAVEVVTSGGMPARIVILYIADSSGVSSNALAQKVRTSLGDFRAGGIFVDVSTSVPQIVDIQLRLAFSANVDTVALSVLVVDAVIEFVNSLAVNQPLLVADLQSVLSRFRDDGLVVSTDATGVNSTIVAPVGDIVPDPGRTIRTTEQNVVVL